VVMVPSGEGRITRAHILRNREKSGGEGKRRERKKSGLQGAYNRESAKGKMAGARVLWEEPSTEGMRFPESAFTEKELLWRGGGSSWKGRQKT